MWNLQQQSQIREAKADAAQAKDDATRSRERIQELEYRINRMALASQALWELVRSRLEITEAELLDKIGEVDLRDGVKDERMTPQIITCPSCGRSCNTKSSRCVFCGAAVPKPHVFQ